MSDLTLVSRYLKPYRRQFVLAALCAFAEATLELCIPFVMASIVDVGVATGDMGLVLALGARMVALAAVAGALGMGYARFSAQVAMGFGAGLREAEYAHVQDFAFSNLDDFDTSSLVTRMTTDVTVIQNALVMGFRPMLRGPVMLVCGLIIACTMSAKLAVVFFVILPALACALALIVHHVAPLFGSMQHAMDQLNDTLQEDLVAIRAIKAYVREGYVAERFEQVNARLANAATRTFRTAVINTPVFTLSMNVASVALLWFGGQMIMAGEMGVGIVLQKNVLFTGTVRDNLRWGNAAATDEELLRACQLACADEFLDRIGGLDADLGHGGGNVSGGQKQRLCIARTLLKHPRVRHGHRRPHTREPRPAHGRHQGRDCAARGLRHGRRPDRGARGRARARHGNARGAAADGRHLSRALRVAGGRHRRDERRRQRRRPRRAHRPHRARKHARNHPKGGHRCPVEEAPPQVPRTCATR